MEKTEVIGFGELFDKIANIYEAGRVVRIEPVDMRNAILSLHFLSTANCQRFNDRNVVLPAGCFGSELMENLKAIPAEKVCSTIDKALEAIENENFTPIERKSHPLTNISFGELESKYGTDILVESIRMIIDVISDKNHNTLINDYAYQIFADLVEDFSKQFPEAALYTTPHDIIAVMRQLVWARREIEQQLPIRKTYDPACGVGYTLAQCGGGEIYGQELNEVTYTLANMAMLLDGRRGHISLGDSLNSPKFWSEISRSEFDVAVSTPPLFLSGWRKTDAYDDMYEWGVPSDHHCEWAFTSQMLSSVNRENGMVCTICSAGALFRAGGEQIIREKVFEDNLVDAIVKLPYKSLYYTAIQIYIVVFRKGRKQNDGVLYLDLSTQYRRSKKRNVLTLDQNIDIQSIYADFLEGKEVAVEGVVKVVKYADLKAELNKGNRLYLLQPFLPQEQEKPTYEKTKAELEQELENLAKRLNECNEKISKELKWLTDNRDNS